MGSDILLTLGSIRGVIDWFAGGSEHGYMTLVHCMSHDMFWIIITVTLDLAVAAGYLMIARHWWRNQRSLPDIPARRALANMRNIFLFCGICGYAFIPIKMVWPAWRLYDMVMLLLVYFTWKYAWSAADLKVIYAELGKTTRLSEELEASRQDAKRRSFFLNAISHDLRTPLNGLLLQASLAEISAETNDQATLHQAIRDMKHCAQASNELLQTLLTFARVDAEDSVTVEPFSLREALASQLELHRPAAEEKGLNLRLDCPSDLELNTDRLRFDRIVANLLSNAVKFTKTGGIRVEVEHAARRADAGKGVEVHVIDTGIGVTADNLPRLFEEFFQVNNDERDRRKGFGLGLAIAHRLAVQLGGDITVHSAPGQGSRFTLAVPNRVATPLMDAILEAGRQRHPLAVVTSG